MKKLVIMLLAVAVIMSPIAASAKTLEESLHSINVEKTAVAVETTVIKTPPTLFKALHRGAYYLVKGVMIALASPFYWAEKVSTKQE